MKKGKNDANEIHELLLDIGLSPSLIGFQYITYALQLALEDEVYLRNVTKLLYIDIAKKYHSTPSSVERCIRHAIATAWTHGSSEQINKLFKNSINPQKGVPTNSQFLARLYFYLTNSPNKRTGKIA